MSVYQFNSHCLTWLFHCGFVFCWLQMRLNILSMFIGHLDNNLFFEVQVSHFSVGLSVLLTCRSLCIVDLSTFLAISTINNFCDLPSQYIFLFIFFKWTESLNVILFIPKFSFIFGWLLCSVEEIFPYSKIIKNSLCDLLRALLLCLHIYICHTGNWFFCMVWDKGTVSVLTLNISGWPGSLLFSQDHPFPTAMQRHLRPARVLVVWGS